MTDSLLPKNTFDFSLLEAGDVLLVANPGDRWYIRTFLFWSHNGLVTGYGGDTAVIDAVREPRSPDDRGPFWQVKYATFEEYSNNFDILALRVKCSPEVKAAAVAYAESKVGTPFGRSYREILFSRKRTDTYSCANLLWQAYKAQGIDLAPFPKDLEWVVLPSAVAKSRWVEVVGMGTRYNTSAGKRGTLSFRLGRWWFKKVLRVRIR